MTATPIHRNAKPRRQVLRQALQEHTRAAYREAILAAAERIMLRDGYQTAKMADIAEATGVSVGTLYNYFDSKEAVFNALLEHHRERFIAYVERPFTSEDPLHQLRELLLRAHEFAEENGALFNLYILYVRTRTSDLNGAFGDPNYPNCLDNTDHQRFDAHVVRLVTLAQESGRIRNDVSVADLVWTLHALMQSILHDWCRHPDQISLKARAEEMMTLYLEGACTR